MKKGTESEESIHICCDKHKQIFTRMGNAYLCMRTLKITDNLILKTKDHICKTINVERI